RGEGSVTGSERGCDQLGGSWGPDWVGDLRGISSITAKQRRRYRVMRGAVLLPPDHGQPRLAQHARQFRQLDEPDCIGAWHPRPLLLVERPTFLDRESETPARLQHPRHLTRQGLLAGER